MGTSVIRLQIATLHRLQPKIQYPLILATHRHVDQTHNATTESALVLPNIMATLTQAVDPNVF
jgi:hypothetical protein